MTPARNYRTRDREDILADLAGWPAPFSMLVTVTNGQVCRGEFAVSVNADERVRAMLTESCHWIPRDPARGAVPGEVGGFFDAGIDEERIEFVVPAAEVLTREQASRALGHWLDTGQKAGEFDWACA